MTEAIDLSDMPEWGPALQKYKADKAAAQENGTDVEVAKVETSWANTKLQLTQSKVSRDMAAAATNGALAEAKALFPNVPVEVYSHLTDPEQIKQVATQVAERMGPPPPPASSSDQQIGGDSWGGSPGSVGGSGPTTPPEETPEQVISRLSPTVMSRGNLAQLENKQLRNASLSNILDRYEPGKSAR